MKRIHVILISLFIVLGLAGLAWMFLYVSNPWNAPTIGDVPCPAGYHRVQDDSPYTAFIRSLPLKRRGARVQLHKGGDAPLQWLSSGVVDMPTLSNMEQCADITMRIRGEFLWKQKRYSDICFTGVDGEKHPYRGGSSRKAFESYMKKVYGTCNTYSVFKETTRRDYDDIRPGDVLVYPSRKKGVSGHAILVADVARARSGKIAILCVEGNTPAREAHVVRNLNPFRNPWHTVTPDKDIWVSAFHFHPKELRHY